MSDVWSFVPCAGGELESWLAKLADADLAFLGRDTMVEPTAAILARFERTGAQVFTVHGAGGPAGLFGVMTSELNPYQGVLDVVLPDAEAQSYVDVISAAVTFCRSRLALRSVLRLEQSRDQRAEHFEQAGMRPVGTLTGAHYSAGAYHDQRVWAGET